MGRAMGQTMGPGRTKGPGPWARPDPWAMSMGGDNGGAMREQHWPPSAADAGLRIAAAVVVNGMGKMGEMGLRRDKPSKPSQRYVLIEQLVNQAASQSE